MRDEAEPGKGAFLRVLDGEALDPPPLWIMRQAGRYLPEYRELRAEAGSFLDLCFTPEMAAEVTLQPVRRFGFDAAILFSDILVVPHAMGQEVRFVEGEGPRLDPLDANAPLGGLSLDGAAERLAPVYETVTRVRADLAAERALIGFCGAPWTVATYMIAGRGTPDQAPARLMAYSAPEAFQALIDALVAVSTDYLLAQIRAGVDAVQIFDTWAGALSEEGFARWCVEPIRRIAQGVRAHAPDARILVFPKGVGARAERLVEAARPDAVGIDWTLDRAFARERLQSRCAVQGNVDPLALLAGGDALAREVDAARAAFSGGRHILNLGHGIDRHTPIAHVEALVERARR